MPQLLYTALLATIGLSRSKPHYKGPPPLRPSCLNHTEGLTSAPDYTPAWDSKTHVAFYDTRRKPRIYDMRMAAALFNTTQVMFHVLLARPPQQPVPGMRVTDISRLPPLAGCLHRNLKRLAHGPGPQYLMKPLLHWVLPREVKRVILLDTDVVVLHGIAPLWALFARFGGDAVLGVGNEQSNLYKKNMTGKNGGVQLLSLAKMRSSRRYTEALDSYASGRDGRWIGFLGDQTLYSYMAHTHASLLHQLGCEWNRQLSMQFGFRNATVHSCPRRCMLLHANFGAIKCVAKYMQLHRGRCDAWRRLLAGEATTCKVKKSFGKAGNRYFKDCCREEAEDAGDAAALLGAAAGAAPPAQNSAAVVV